MPTQHVEPQSDDHLHSVSNSLLKARRVVVITGAGISTSSGIPDFRSEAGLYSLVQAQFDAAIRRARRVEPSASSQLSQDNDQDRPAKRRKTDSGDIVASIVARSHDGRAPDVAGEIAEVLAKSEVELLGSRTGDTAGKDTESCDTPQSKSIMRTDTNVATSPLSSPPPDHLIITPFTLRPPPDKRLTDAALPQSSSPLSSPPPSFHHFAPSSPTAAMTSRRSSTSASETDTSPPSSNPLSSSQTSNSSRSTLPNMKGRDLFDATIWSDPVKTSVFYTFATSLRQKIKTVQPSSSHRFISHLRDRGKLVRCYTQNIDQIEEKVGLSTCLLDGPGRRNRFSRRSTANANQLEKMAAEAFTVVEESIKPEKQSSSDDQSASGSSQSDTADVPNGAENANTEADATTCSQPKAVVRAQKRVLPSSGVECVFLHGSLQLLRCFLCGRVCSWDDDERESETLTGQQPECPHCVGATAAREEKGKRALGVGKLRPDIVLYGEEHPSSHLISPIVTHDLALQPDMLLILGTSLRVHGLKVMVREFAKAVHSKGGTVVFVNLTKPPESSWGDVIDYWIQWDCDAWVADLQDRIPRLWHDVCPKKKRESSGKGDVGLQNVVEKQGTGGKGQAGKEKRKKRKEQGPGEKDETRREKGATGPKTDGKAEAKQEKGRRERETDENPGSKQQKVEKKRQPAVRPMATRDTKATGAYWTTKVLQDLSKITGNILLASEPLTEAVKSTNSTPKEPAVCSLLKKGKARAKASRKSAPGALESKTGCEKLVSKTVVETARPAPASIRRGALSAILNPGKENTTPTKRKITDQDKVIRVDEPPRRHLLGPELPPLRPSKHQQPTPACLYGRPQPLEPKSPPSGPLMSLSSNLQTARPVHVTDLLGREPMALQPVGQSFRWSSGWTGDMDRDKGTSHATDVVMHTQYSSGDAKRSPCVFDAENGNDWMMGGTMWTGQGEMMLRPSLEGRLMDWGRMWSCRR